LDDLDFLPRSLVTGQGATVLNWKRADLDWTSCPKKLWMPLLDSIPGQAGWGFEQPSIVEGVPAHGREVGTR